MESNFMLGILDFKMFFNLDKNLRARHQPRPQKNSEVSKQRKFFTSFLCCFRPYFQLRDAFAAVYFVNGLFQLSLSVARVRPDPPEAEPLKFAHFLTSRKRSGQRRWALKSESILICLSPER